MSRWPSHDDPVSTHFMVFQMLIDEHRAQTAQQHLGAVSCWTATATNIDHGRISIRVLDRAYSRGMTRHTSREAGPNTGLGHTEHRHSFCPGHIDGRIANSTASLSITEPFVLDRGLRTPLTAMQTLIVALPSSRPRRTDSSHRILLRYSI